MANLTEAQFQQLLARVSSGSKRKLATFASGDSTEWLQWRAGFSNVRALNNWNDADAVAHIKAAMTGYAAMAVQGMDHATPNGLLDLYEAKFCTAAASVQARQQFLAATQDEKESITAWHTRVKMLYRRSDVNADMERTKELVDKFIFGLAHETVLERTLDARPTNMTDALAEATNRAATLATIKEMGGRKPGVGLHSMKVTKVGVKPQEVEKKCFNCDSPAHMVKECPQPRRVDKVNKAFDDIRGRGRRTRYRQRGGSGGNSGGGKSGNNGGSTGAIQKVSVNALVDALGKIQVVEDEPKVEQQGDKNQGN